MLIVSGAALVVLLRDEHEVFVLKVDDVAGADPFTVVGAFAPEKKITH